MNGITLSATFSYWYAECHDAECHDAECHDAECHDAEFLGATYNYFHPSPIFADKAVTHSSGVLHWAIYGAPRIEWGQKWLIVTNTQAYIISRKIFLDPLIFLHNNERSAIWCQNIL
jgi:hypothetical protein